MEQTVHRNMGLGKLTDPQLIFARKFRWTLEGPGFEEHYVKTCHVDLKKKLLTVEIYEVYNDNEEMVNDQWVDSFHHRRQSDKHLDLTMFDGCGRPLDRIRMEDLDLLSDEMDFDYASSDPLIRRVVIQFTRWSRKFIEKSERVKGEGHWKMQVIEGAESTDKVPVNLKDRPHLEVEETEITHKEGKVWIPGKAAWKELQVHFDRTKHPALLEAMQAGARQVLLQLFDNNGYVRESWWLNNVWVSKLDANIEQNTILGLRFSDVNYLPSEKDLTNANA